MDHARALTRNNRSMLVNFAVNYGSRAEIVDACRALAADAVAGKLKPQKIDEDRLADRLYDPTSRDLDLLIRTGGQVRLSNFMLWQASYAELVVMPILWPDFRKRHLDEAIEEFKTRQRNFGARPRS
jgi:undecaprenyl diphosphate synthase